MLARPRDRPRPPLSMLEDMPHPSRSMGARASSIEAFWAGPVPSSSREPKALDVPLRQPRLAALGGLHFAADDHQLGEGRGFEGIPGPDHDVRHLTRFHGSILL